MAVLSIASYLCAIYFIKYAKHEIQTNRRTDRMIEMPLPAIMICQHTFCYNSRQIEKSKWSDNYILTSKPCHASEIYLIKGNTTSTKLGDKCIIVNPKGEMIQTHVIVPVTFKLATKDYGIHIALGDPGIFASLTTFLSNSFNFEGTCFAEFSMQRTVYERLSFSDCSKGKGIDNYF